MHIANGVMRGTADLFTDMTEVFTWSLNAQNVPLISECLACFECRRYADFDGGDHSLLLGLVEQVSVFEGVPLTFAQGRFNTSEERGR